MTGHGVVGQLTAGGLVLHGAVPSDCRGGRDGDDFVLDQAVL